MALENTDIFSCLFFEQQLFIYLLALPVIPNEVAYLRFKLGASVISRLQVPKYFTKLTRKNRLGQ